MSNTELKREAKNMAEFMDDLAVDCKLMASEIANFLNSPSNNPTDPFIWPVMGRLKDYSGMLEHKTKELQNLLNP